jgi:sugar-specific transcriptional regulator TrmB
MTAASRDDDRERAVDALTDLGFGVYAARTFVALTELSGGTAVEVSDAADVPRTRVYDAVEELSETNLVRVEDSTPKRFTPVSADEAAERLLAEYRSRTETLRESLSAVETDRERG